MPKDFHKSPEIRRGMGIDSLSQPSEGTDPADTLTSDFQPPEL